MTITVPYIIFTIVSGPDFLDIFRFDSYTTIPHLEAILRKYHMDFSRSREFIGIEDKIIDDDRKKILIDAVQDGTILDLYDPFKSFCLEDGVYFLEGFFDHFPDIFWLTFDIFSLESRE